MGTHTSSGISLMTTCRRALCLTAAVLIGASCTSSTEDSSSTSSATAATAVQIDTTAAIVTDPADASSSSATPTTSQSSPATEAMELFDSNAVHSVSLEFDQADYDEMIAAFQNDGDKTWIEATITVDGVAYAQSGIRLKGNSSLAGIGGGSFGPGLRPGAAGAPTSTAGDESEVAETGTTPNDSVPAAVGAPVIVMPGGDLSVDEPEGLPWLVRLDKYVENQNHRGVTEFVIRSNETETALNEAVALELLDQAGLAAQRPSPIRLRVNGSDEVLRLIVENPNDEWMAANFSEEGYLYKADAQGDYSYRGTDAAAYGEAFEQEAGDADLNPLIDFLDFINNSSDDEFATELDEHLDVDAFADYLAMQDLIDNFDDIDGPGNNSYLHFDLASKKMTVVAWDHNLAFGAMVGGPGGPPGPGGAEGRPGGVQGGPTGGFPLPEGCEPPAGAQPGQPIDMSQIPPACLPPGLDPDNLPGGFERGGPMNRTNILVERFNKNPEFVALYEAAKVRLRETLYLSGDAQAILDRWVAVIEAQADDLVDATTVEEEAGAIAAYFTKSS